MSFPVADWQFWVVTATAVGALWALVRPFLGNDGESTAQAPCAKCGTSASGASCGHSGSAEPKLVTLGGNRPS